MRLLILLFFIVFIFGCGDKEPVKVIKDSNEPSYGDTFVRSESGDPDVINPLISNGMPAVNVEDLVFDSLIKYNGDIKIVGDLAKDWKIETVNNIWYIHFNKKTIDKVSAKNLNILITKDIKTKFLIENTKIINDFYSEKPEILKIKFSKDIKSVDKLLEDTNIDKKYIRFSFAQRKITFNLRKDVKWHDGERFSSKDVKFTYETTINKKIDKISWRDPFLVIDELNCPDDYTVVVTYKAPHFLIFTCWTQSIVPEHILKNKDIEKCEFNYSPVGTGPYKVVKWQRQEMIQLRSNHDYFKGRPYINNILIRNIPDRSVNFQELVAGNIDELTLSSDQYTRQKKDPEFNSRFNLYNLELFNSYVYLGYNLESPLFSDKNVRIAIAHAIDADNIIENILHGMGKRITGPFKPLIWAYNKNVKPLEYNIKLAKKMLAEAGWKDTNNNGIIDKNGIEFSFSIMAGAGKTLTPLFIQDNLKKVGIKVKVERTEWVTTLKKYRKRDFDAYIGAWRLGVAPNLYSIWHSKNIPSKENGYYGMNYVGYINSKIDSLIEKSLYTVDIEKRKEIFHKCHKIIYDDQPYCFLYSSNTKIAVSKRFKNIKPLKAGIDYNLEKWWVPLSKQKYRQ